MQNNFAKKHIAVILKGYPRLSETFIAQELHALEQAGAAITIFSLRRPTDATAHPMHRAIRASVIYLPEYLHREPRRVLRAWWRLRRWSSNRSHYARALKFLWRDWRRDWWRDLGRNRIRRFGQALVLADELPAGIQLLYAHFLHTPASVAMYAGEITQIPWAASAHAKDIWTLPRWEKQEKLNACRWLTTCTRANFLHLRALAEAPNKVHLNYHGINLSQFPQSPRAATNRDGGSRMPPVRILSVGRAVEKKGYAELLAALAELPRELHWELWHIGGGPLLPSLRRQAARLGLAARVHWCGPQPQPVVLDAYRAADFFALNCRIINDGDRDGLPNVLLEAMRQGLPVVATELSGIPELIDDGVNGLLVAPDDHRALGNALRRLITDVQLRNKLGAAGFATVQQKFDMQKTFPALRDLIMGGG